MKLRLTDEDCGMIADILEPHYEDTVANQHDHYIDDDTDYFARLQYLEELIDKVTQMIGDN